MYVNAWGGGDAINAYIAWAPKEDKTRYGFEVRHVKITDAADVVKRVQTEMAAGRTTDGSVDLLWVNGKNFRNLKNSGLLFGPLSVGQNLALTLPANVKGTQARQQRVAQTLVDIGLDGFHGRDPATLSGGQRARVSLMRTLIGQPQALLLDEPFSKLDTELRQQFRGFVFGQIERQRIPTLLVTHDPADVPEAGRVISASGSQDSQMSKAQHFNLKK